MDKSITKALDNLTDNVSEIVEDHGKLIDSFAFLTNNMYINEQKSFSETKIMNKLLIQQSENIFIMIQQLRELDMKISDVTNLYNYCKN